MFLHLKFTNKYSFTATPKIYAKTIFNPLKYQFIFICSYLMTMK